MNIHEDIFPAHITYINGEQRIQTVSEHLCNVSEYASKICACFKLENAARLAGLIHDIGKYTKAYKNYIEKASNGEKVVRGSVNHTFAGVIWLMERYHEKYPLSSEMIAYAVGAHHGNFDICGFDGNGFSHRLDYNRDDIDYSNAISAFLSDFPNTSYLDELMENANAEINKFIDNLGNCGEKGFNEGMTVRLIQSALIDADRRDTSEFMNGISLEPKSADWGKELKNLEDRLKNIKSNANENIKLSREYFSNKCAEFAAVYKDGIYKLTLPTGAGKTLASLRLALANAAAFNKERIFFVIPLLSVIEQNAKVIRENISDESIIAEHHSNVVSEKDSNEELDMNELLTECWDKPIMVTTLVQLLNTLFSGKTSCIRRMKSLRNSVIIIDEVQSLPKKTIDMFNSAMNFLAKNCGAMIVLSSATQPVLDMPWRDSRYAVRSLKYSEPANIVPYDDKYFNCFKRTRIYDCRSRFGFTIEEFSDFVLDKSNENPSLLVICNTKKSSLELHRHLQGRTDAELVYLSAGMCMRHRVDTVDRINWLLSKKEKVICVSTQVVEAGVDFSFSSVIRVIAGVDNIIQAAGRCNRGGEFSELGDVYVVNLNDDAENLRMLKEIKFSQQCTSDVLDFMPDNSDLSDEENINTYYECLFKDKKTCATFSYLINKFDIETSIYELLSGNRVITNLNKNKNGKYRLHQSFKTAGELFCVFDQSTTDVIVPYNEGAQIIADLNSERAQYDMAYAAELFEKAKPYTINLFRYQVDQLNEEGMLHSDINKRFICLDVQNYSDNVGLCMEGQIFNGGGII